MVNNRKPRILWLTNLPAPYRFPIWDRMAESCDLKVVFLLGEKNWRNWNVNQERTWSYEFLELTSVHLNDLDLIPGFLGVEKILKNIDLLILGGWETPFYIRASRLAKKKKIKVIQFYESTMNSHRFDNFLVRKIRSSLMSNADLVITIGQDSTSAVQAMGVTSHKILTLFNPADVKWFQEFAQNQPRQKVLGHHFIYVGQLIKRKNVENIILSFAAIKNSRDTLTIVGDGLLFANLKKLVASHGLSDSVFFTGHLNKEELAKVYSKSNTLILASTNEVWGLVVSEALASGLHVVVSDKCGVVEHVRNMPGVFVCSPNQESIQNAMKYSSKKWNGHIQEPQILQFTPEKFADAVVDFLKFSNDFKLPD